jgi:hypothetical protein
LFDRKPNFPGLEYLNQEASESLMLSNNEILILKKDIETLTSKVLNLEKKTESLEKEISRLLSRSVHITAPTPQNSPEIIIKHQIPTEETKETPKEVKEEIKETSPEIPEKEWVSFNELSIFILLMNIGWSLLTDKATMHFYESIEPTRYYLIQKFEMAMYILRTSVILVVASNTLEDFVSIIHFGWLSGDVIQRFDITIGVSYIISSELGLQLLYLFENRRNLLLEWKKYRYNVFLLGLTLFTSNWRMAALVYGLNRFIELCTLSFDFFLVSTHTNIRRALAAGYLAVSLFVLFCQFVWVSSPVFSFLLLWMLFDKATESFKYLQLSKLF